MDDKTRLAHLRSVIDRTAQLYYTPGGDSGISDDDYDAMMDELRALDPTDHRLTRVGVPYSAEDIRSKRTHSIPMGSLTNTDNGIDGFEDWYDKTLALLGVDSASVHASLKMDGNSVALQYENGVLVEAISRGDGEVGESLTANAVKWMGIPTVLSAPFNGTVRGEAILYLDEFNKLKNDDPSLTNARNVGSGILGRIDGAQNELIRFVGFNIVDKKIEFPSLEMKFKLLERLNFTPARSIIATGTRDNVITRIKSWFAEIESKRDQLPHEIDGIVVMINDCKLQKQITLDRKDELRPKYGRAIKFATQKSITRVVGVNITMGHTGVIVPTAIVEPVLCGGVTISNVLLNNWNADSKNLSAAHVAIGDVVEVARQGDVIPKLHRVVTTVYRCPKCGFTGTAKEQEQHHAS